jgi:hypothetical protein
MVSNHTGYDIGVLAERYRGRGLLGHLYSPGAQRGPFEELPYALDNGAYPLWEKNLDWQPGPWLRLLDWAARAKFRPLWALVPDVITDRDRTLERWGEYVGAVSERGFRPAFALQDGMTFDDVPSGDCILFVGGTTKWKEDAIEPWCARFPGRVHVGRVNHQARLLKAQRAGAVSVDGNGWFRKTNQPGARVQRDDLVAYLESQVGRKAA